MEKPYLLALTLFILSIVYFIMCQMGWGLGSLIDRPSDQVKAEAELTRAQIDLERTRTENDLRRLTAELDAERQRELLSQNKTGLYVLYILLALAVCIGFAMTIAAVRSRERARHLEHLLTGSGMEPMLTARYQGRTYRLIPHDPDPGRAVKQIRRRADS